VANGIVNVTADRMVFANLTAPGASLNRVALLLRVAALLVPALILAVAGLNGLTLLLHLGAALNGVTLVTMIGEVMKVGEFEARLQGHDAVGADGCMGRIEDDVGFGIRSESGLKIDVVAGSYKNATTRHQAYGKKTFHISP
jgi:hypothetical protein